MSDTHISKLALPDDLHEIKRLGKSDTCACAPPRADIEDALVNLIIGFMSRLANS